MTCAYETMTSWLLELGRIYNTPLSLDGEGYCFLAEDKGSTLMIAAPRTSEHFSIRVDLMPVTADNKHEIFEQALRLNLHHQKTLGASIALDPECNTLVLDYLGIVEHTNFTEFQNILHNLMRCSKDIRQELLLETSPIAKYGKQTADIDLNSALRI